MRTLRKRPDLLQKKILNRQEIEILDKWRREISEILELQTEKEAKSLNRSKKPE
jgi:hypothetical protein